MNIVLRRSSRDSSTERPPAIGVDAATVAPASTSVRKRSAPSDLDAPGPDGVWGRNLLAGVGLVLTGAGMAITMLPFLVHTPGMVAAPGAVIFAVGVLLVVMAAFFDSTRGTGHVPGWSISFGRAETANRTEDDDRSRAEIAPTGASFRRTYGVTSSSRGNSDR